MTRPIVMDIIARDNASKTFKSVADSQTKLAKQTDGLAKNSDNLRKAQLGLVAAQERYNKAASDGKASVGQLASAQKSLITAQQGVRKATADTGAEVGRFGARAKLAFAAAGLAAAGFVKASIDAARDQQKANAQTAAVIKSTGGAANVTTKQVEDLAGSISKLTGIQDDQIQSGENMLLTFTNVRNEVGKGNDIFTQATKTVTDMSVALGEDTKTAAIQLGKALQDPISGVTALRRVGVQLTDQQRDQIKVLMATGDTMGAQKIILQELNKEFGGSAAAQATAADKAAASWKEFQESIGTVVLPVLDGFLKVATGIIDVVGKYAPVIVPLVGVLGGFAGAVWAVNAASRAWAATQTALTTVFGEQFVTRLGAAAAGLGSMAGPLGIVVAAATGAFFAFDQLDKQWDIFTTHIPKGITGGLDIMKKSLLANGGVVDDNVKKNLALTFSTTDLKESFAKSGLGLADYTTIITGSAKESDRLFAAWTAGADPSAKLTNGVWQQVSAYREFSAKGKDVALTQGQIGGALKGTNQQILAQQTFLNDNNLTVETATAKYRDAVTAAHSFTAELGYLSTALAQQSGNAVNAKLGALQYTDALTALGDQVAANTKEFNDNGTSLNTNTVEGRKNYEWALQQIQAINNLAVTQATATGSIKTGTDSLKTNEDALRTSMRQAGFTKKQVDDLITTYGATPGKISTSIEEQGSKAVLDALGNILNQLHAIADPVWGAKFDFAMNNPSLKRGFARGGQITGPGGPTADMIPARLSAGEYVVNAAATQKHLALLENINSNKFAFGGQVGRIPQVPGVAQAAGVLGDLLINSAGLASEANQFNPVLFNALKAAAAKNAAQFAPAGVPAPGNISALQAYAFSLFGKYGWGSGALGSLIALWNGESGWNPNAVNQSSGAWGIPQSLPADKMASAGADWRTNGATQIRWGLDYINSVYGSPTNAYSAWLSRSPHWYGQGAWNVPADQLAGLHRGEMVIPAKPAEQIRAGVGGMQVGPINIAVYAAAGMSAEQVARQTADQIRAVLDDRERRYAKGARA